MNDGNDEFFKNVGKDKLVVLIEVESHTEDDPYLFDTILINESELPEGSKFLRLTQNGEEHGQNNIKMPAGTKVYQSKEVLRILEDNKNVVDEMSEWAVNVIEIDSGAGVELNIEIPNDSC